MQPKLKHAAVVLSFALSFWSSGVFFIRILGTYDIWGSSAYLSALYAFSIPLVYISIRAVKGLFASQAQAISVVVDTLASVLLVHALLLSTIPTIYALEPSSSLRAAAWLLWFGGLAVVLSRHRQSQS